MLLMRIYISEPNAAVSYKVELVGKGEGPDEVQALKNKALQLMVDAVQNNYGRSGDYFIECNTGDSNGIIDHDEGLFHVDVEAGTVKECGCKFCRGVNYLVSMSPNKITVDIVFGITNNNIRELVESGHVTAQTDFNVNFCFSCGRKN